MSNLTRRDILGVAAAGAVLLPTHVHSSTRSATAWQTEGPFFPTHIQSDRDKDMTMVEGQTKPALGEVIEVSGQILDVSGNPIAGAIIDIWQANAAGRYAHEKDNNSAPLDPQFQGWAQLVSTEDGHYWIRTIKPGAYPAEQGWTRPPHIHYKVARRGYHELTTQLYFKGDPLNHGDRLLDAVPEAERADLIGDFSSGTATFDIVLAQV